MLGTRKRTERTQARRKRARRSVSLLASLALAGLGSGPLNAQSPSATSAKPIDDSAYIPLQLYNGSWKSVMGTGPEAKPILLINHCERTGLFFACEQKVNGESQALVVFLPQGANGATQTYRTNALTAAATRPGGWGKLEITGDRWVYSSEDEENGAKVYWQTVNVFSGPDRIHFEIQRSADAKTWQTTMSGDEQRAK